jgi:dnd system-associated protein 4
LEGCRTEPVPEEVFAKNDDALESIRIVALAEKKDQSIFGEENVDEMVTIFEEYAHGGMKVIQRFMQELPTDILGADAIIEGLRKEGLLDKVSPAGNSGNLSGVEF